MSDIAIKVENLSKIYRLGEIGTGTISKDVQRWFTTKVRGKEDPFLKIGQTNDRTAKSGVDDIVYSLQNINFTINQGDAVGIIGRNGAGKSTLLKILSRVTAPTTGKINIKGRVASLLEVGTGFHPELTGRENIFLNGAILGMRKKEIARKLDEIIDFSGVERYIDTPVKRYSSGMYVRLAFAVAAYLESEILIVDEVLAVGDAEFQKKCLGKMGDVSKGEGRTVLFVSHNMGAIAGLCSSSILLNHGNINFQGPTPECINKYLATNKTSNQSSYLLKNPSSKERGFIKTIRLLNDDRQECTSFDVFENVFLEIDYTLLENLTSIHLCMNLYKDGMLLWRSFDTDLNDSLLNTRLKGEYQYQIKLPHILKAGSYSFNFYIGVVNGMAIDAVEEVITFDVIEKTFDPSFKSYSKNREGVMVALPTWNIK